jgi:hypothetical protein
MRYLLLVVIALVLLSSTASSRTWHVKADSTGDAPTIQAGLDSAASFDTVMVEAGEYHEVLFWPFRNSIALIGSGMESTVVIGDSIQTVLYMAEIVEIDTTTIIRGLRFRRGGDAGVALNGASPLMEACAVDSTSGGPGVHCWGGCGAIIRECHIEDGRDRGILLDGCDSTMTISTCTISRNLQLDHPYEGGGVHCINSPYVTITDNTIEANRAEQGGGIYIYSCGGVVIGNTITGNVAFKTGSPGWGGGGIYCRYTDPGTKIVRNIIHDNAAYSGAGILLYDAELIVWGNMILSNTADYSGGGITCYAIPSGDYIEVNSNIIFGNEAHLGGGVFCQVAQYATIDSNVICDNVALEHGGGMYRDAMFEPSQYNTLTRNHANINGGAVYFNTCHAEFSFNTVTENSSDGDGDGLFTHGSYFPTIRSCNVCFNGWGGYNDTYLSSPVAQDNWWGHESGPWHEGNPTGKGDSLSLYFYDFTPWLTTPDLTAPLIPPIGLCSLLVGTDTTLIKWRSSPIPGIAGYRIWYRENTPGPPFTDTLDVGLDTLHYFSNVGAMRYVAVACYDSSGRESWCSASIPISPNGIAGVGDICELDNRTPRLLRNSPNPFASSTLIAYRLDEAGAVEVSVYNIEGRLVERLVSGRQPAGLQTCAWDATGLAPGVYLCRIQIGAYAETRKMILMK